MSRSRRSEPLPQIMKNVRYKKGRPLDDAKVRIAIESGEQRLNGQGRLVIRPSGTDPRADHSFSTIPTRLFGMYRIPESTTSEAPPTASTTKA